MVKVARNLTWVRSQTLMSIDVQIHLYNTTRTFIMNGEKWCVQKWTHLPAASAIIHTTTQTTHWLCQKHSKAQKHFVLLADMPTQLFPQELPTRAWLEAYLVTDQTNSWFDWEALSDQEFSNSFSHTGFSHCPVERLRDLGVFWKRGQHVLVLSHERLVQQ